MSIKRWCAHVVLESGIMFSRQISIRNVRETYSASKKRGSKMGLKPLDHWVYETVINDIVSDLQIDPDTVLKIKIRQIGYGFGGFDNAQYT